MNHKSSSRKVNKQPEKLSEMVMVRLTPTQKQELEAFALKDESSVSRVIRRLAFKALQGQPSSPAEHA